jgi:hypothetical protein
VKPSGIEPATYRHALQYLNQLLARQRTTKWEINIRRKEFKEFAREPQTIYLFVVY